MNWINTILGIPFGYIMYFCNELVQNYGFAIILFTLITKILQFPLNIWVQKNSIKMVEIQPQLNNIAAVFAGKRDTIAEKQLALYKEKNYKPLAGVVPMLIQIPIILGLIAVVYNPLQHLLHMDAQTIAALTQIAARLTGLEYLDSGAQIRIVELANNPQYADAFAAMAGSGLADAVALMRGVHLDFLGLNMAMMPSITNLSILVIIPLLSGASALFLSVIQNLINVLQQAAGWLGRWGVAIFLTLFSIFFAFIVPAGIGLYWIFSNLISTLTMFLVNLIYPPEKYVDYAELEKSKIALAQSKVISAKLRPTAEQKAKGRADYKRFFENETEVKQVVFYSEKSGFYKYFKDYIRYILEHSDIVIHYVTSDPKDQVFGLESERLKTYYIDDNKLVILFMKIETQLFIMTTPGLQHYQLKRSLVKKEAEYVYVHHYPLSVTLTDEIGALSHFDTVFCVGDFQIAEIRQTEEHYQYKPKKLVVCGYPVLEDMKASFDSMEKVNRQRKKILIAPSWQEGNILDSCLDEIIRRLWGEKYQIVVRPHPEYVKRFPLLLNSIVEKYKDKTGDGLLFELDFSDSSSLFNSDLVISDWSGAAYEAAYVTEKPVLLINTPPKITNPEYDVIASKPLEFTLRDKIGMQLEPDNMDALCETVETLLASGEEYQKRIAAIRSEYIAHFGQSAAIGGQYIIDRIEGNDTQHYIS